MLFEESMTEFEEKHDGSTVTASSSTLRRRHRMISVLVVLLVLNAALLMGLVFVFRDKLRGNRNGERGVPTSSAVAAIETTETTVQPSEFPSESPSALSPAPTEVPSLTPSMEPTQFPTSSPSELPIGNPTTHPSVPPTEVPSSKPSQIPSNGPTLEPSQIQQRTMARSETILEMELIGIDREQPVDEKAFESVCAAFFAEEIQMQPWQVEEGSGEDLLVENVGCQVIVAERRRRQLQGPARSVSDYRVIRAIVWAKGGEESIPLFHAYLQQIVVEGGDDMVNRLIEASQTFQHLRAIQAAADPTAMPAPKIDESSPPTNRPSLRPALIPSKSNSPTIAPTPEPILFAVGEGGCTQSCDPTGTVCSMACAGRPFRNGDGAIISSQALELQHKGDGTGSERMLYRQPHYWSELIVDSTFSVALEGQFPAVMVCSNDEAPEPVRISRLALEWTRQALGEHASIASFAAFAIALMSNQAPPHLIQQSLTAAQDEYRHAQTAFSVATLLGAKNGNQTNAALLVEPSALPPTQLKFGPNKTELVLGAAREGCIEETLSALRMAAQVDADLRSLSLPCSGHDDELTRMLADISRTIALEEAAHSALAWNTVQWICSADQEACSVARNGVMNPSYLSNPEILGQFGETSDLESAWNCVWGTLLPMVITNNTPDDDKVATTPAADQENATCANELRKDSVVGEVVRKIVDMVSKPEHYG